METDGWRPTTPEEEKAIGDVLWKAPAGGRDRKRYLAAMERMRERERVPWFPLVMRSMKQRRRKR